MDAIEFINIVCPEHDRTSCSDENISNGFYVDDFGHINFKYRVRCKRCMYLQIAKGEVNLENAKSYFRAIGD